MNLREFFARNRGFLFAVPAGALAVLVVVAAINFDQGSAAPRRQSRIEGAEELLAPRTASAEELARASGSIADQTAVTLAAGAWIQVADEDGRLAQQYSATKLDPLPGSQLSMAEPRAVIYMKDGRVLALAARKGVAFVPRRALESGTLEQDVEVRLFKPVDGQRVDIDRDTPAVVVTADQAQFDGVLGEVRCERAVRVATDAGSFAGEGLSLVLDGDGDGIERLTVDRALEPIRIDRAARAMAAKRREEREGARPAPAAPPADAAATAEPRERPAGPAFYRLVLSGGVLVERTRDGELVNSVRGEELLAVFSLESKGLDELAFAPVRALPQPAAGAVDPRIAPVALAFAQSAGDTPADGVTVTFGGRLVMLPATAPEDQLASIDDIRFDVVGRVVELVDARSQSRTTCRSLRYSVRDEQVWAAGADGAPLSLSSPRLALEAARFHANLATGEARLDGAGRMAFARGAARGVSMLEVAPSLAPDLSRMLASADPSMVALLDPPADRFRFDPAAQELEIQWKGGVDLKFTGSLAQDAEGEKAREQRDSRLERARFDGGVTVAGRQFELGSSTLEVGFDPAADDRVDSIVADGGVRVERRGAVGAMSAERLELYLAANAKGDSVPRRLVARKGIEARDERQTVWTEDLLVTFREKPVVAAADGAMVDAGEFGQIDVEKVEAKGGVQVLLREGARVFAQELSGDAAKRTLRLTGDDVAIVRSNLVADGLRDLRFDEATRSARSEGAGRFRTFRTPLALGEGRIERPRPQGNESLDASWTGSFDYAEVAEERGTLDIRGDVKVRSRPTDSGSDAVDAQAILLEIGLDPKTKRGGANTAQGERALEHFIAKGDARVESRTWPDATKTGEPRVFKVSGEHVEYDLRTREGLVVGDGTILVNVPAAPEAKAVDAARPAGAIGLGGDGTTRFRWKRRMALEKQYDDVFRIAMDDEVEMLHAGLRADDTMSMRCDRLEAIVRRPESARAAEERPADAQGVDLGGPAELLGVKATGGVFIRTPEQDIECGAFDYSVKTGIATLTAAEGRTVTVMVKGQPAPVRAAEVTWDMRNGRLQVTKASATVGR